MLALYETKLDGKPVLRFNPNSGSNQIEGLVTNGTSQRLRNVYFVYYDPAEGQEQDQVLFQPAWEKSQTIDLADFNDLKTIKVIGTQRDAANSKFYALPEQQVRLRGPMGRAGATGR